MWERPKEKTNQLPWQFIWIKLRELWLPVSRIWRIRRRKSGAGWRREVLSSVRRKLHLQREEEEASAF